MADKEYLFAVRGYALADVSVTAGSFEEAEARVWAAIGCSEGQEGRSGWLLILVWVLLNAVLLPTLFRFAVPVFLGRMGRGWIMHIFP